MSRTRRRKSYTNWWNKDSAQDRRWTVQNYRAKCKQRIREGRYEMPIFKSTGGMITW